MPVLSPVVPCGRDHLPRDACLCLELALDRAPFAERTGRQAAGRPLGRQARDREGAPEGVTSPITGVPLRRHVERGRSLSLISFGLSLIFPPNLLTRRRLQVCVFSPRLALLVLLFSLPSTSQSRFLDVVDLFSLLCSRARIDLMHHAVTVRQPVPFPLRTGNRKRRQSVAKRDVNRRAGSRTGGRCSACVICKVVTSSMFRKTDVVLAPQSN